VLTLKVINKKLCQWIDQHLAVSLFTKQLCPQTLTIIIPWFGLELKASTPSCLEPWRRWWLASHSS